jgi:replicative DNA helicase
MRRPLEVMPQAAPQPANWQDVSRAASEVAPAAMHAHFPWRSLRDIHGPLLPGRLYIVSARTGSGKTLFVRTLIEGLCGTAEPTPVAYWGTETPPAEIVRALAAARLGVHPARIEEDDFSGVPGGYGAFGAMCSLVSAEWLAPGRGNTPPRLSLYGDPRPAVQRIRLALEDAADRGVRVFIVDHILRLSLDEERLFPSATEAVRTLKQAAQDLGMVGIVTSQQNRAANAGDKLGWFAAPDLSALKGSGALEEEADGVLFLFRRLRPDLTEPERHDVRAGKIPLKSAILPNVMGVAIGKARVDGSRTHEETSLWVEHGRVTDLPPAEALAQDAAAHGIRTNRDL